MAHYFLNERPPSSYKNLYKVQVKYQVVASES